MNKTDFMHKRFIIPLNKNICRLLNDLFIFYCDSF